MRNSIVAAMAAACMAVGLSFAAVDPPLGTGEQAQIAKQQHAAGKPVRRGADTCRWANDNECDEPDIGTGACGANTDYSDCRYLREGETDACRWARDGECDEPSFGTGACVQGSDRSDCGNVSQLRFRNDSCTTAFNGVCDEPGIGTGRCERRTDRRDCVGAERPMTINDHFFGRDDRVMLNRAEFPWRAVGQLELDGGEACTATLIGPDVLVTAAHCIHSDAGLDARGRFITAPGFPGGPFEARVTAYYIDARFNYQRFNGGDEIDGLDWALLRLDRRLGDQLGYLGVRNLTGEGIARAREASLLQGGYSWDTGDHLSGNIGCHIVRIHPDGTFAHECDTTRGDSGSAFIVRSGANYSVIGVDSNFRTNPNGPFIYIAVSAANFERYVRDFMDGRIGTPVRGARGTRPKG